VNWLTINPAFLNELDQSELSTMPKDRSTTGPMRTQPIERASIIATPVLPVVPTAGKMKKAQPKQKPTRNLGRLPTRPDGALMRLVSPRIIHIPLSGGDRKAQAKGIRYAHGLLRLFGQFRRFEPSDARYPG
jgi:hypothetical protein